MADNQTAVSEESTVEKMDTTPAETPAPAAQTTESDNNEAGIPTNVLAANGGQQQTNAAAAQRNTSTIPTRQYLDSTVVPILLQGLGALAKDRPENPIEYLANFLLREKDRYNSENQAPANQTAQ
ncbi:unnamed protein product [Caenorhabditis sp. 36 PRJEB53466]|nr:unnamed protein product [Caenorhabditis sp. 36 PRJEB53466]